MISTFFYIMILLHFKFLLLFGFLFLSEQRLYFIPCMTSKQLLPHIQLLPSDPLIPFTSLLSSIPSICWRPLWYPLIPLQHYSLYPTSKTSTIYSHGDTTALTPSLPTLFLYLSTPVLSLCHYCPIHYPLRFYCSLYSHQQIKKVSERFGLYIRSLSWAAILALPAVLFDWIIFSFCIRTYIICVQPIHYIFNISVSKN